MRGGKRERVGKLKGSKVSPQLLSKKCVPERERECNAIERPQKGNLTFGQKLDFWSEMRRFGQK